ncbi:L-threonine synthase [Dongia mobilis]|uniref:Threonine synthase n=1 Tax=Dongia mobilis TaxID=578943 RepID=A0A4R6WRG1_9PROT|nr:threonine synthase [Dongia mobilis]TDQ82416.1 L-threonine synthase [Dongia mobilis]
MRYISTRGQAPRLGFEEALLTGLARDGGLYVPETWPQLGKAAQARLAGQPYGAVAAQVMRPFVGRSLAGKALQGAIAEAYGTFRHQAVAPLVQIDEGLWLMELFHGPTLAFKDVALQLLGQLYDRVLKARGERITVIGATSGDTGSAALEACRDRAAIDIFILHPKGRVSEVQRRQMTTIDAANVHNIAIDGSFDDCQDLVKAMFNDQAFRDRVNMAAVNSINWARVLAQVVYYVTGAIALGAPHRAVSFAVPSGNFGNVYAGYAAKSMGLPIERLIVGSNRNDILTRFFSSGAMKITRVTPSLSPSMDIQVSSNLERLLFDLFDRKGEKLAAAMQEFRRSGHFTAPQRHWGRVAKTFHAHRLDDRQTLAAMRDVHRRTGMLVDPHSAIGLAAALDARRSAAKSATPIISLATAHPAKFPDAVEQATGIRPALPSHLAHLMSARERLTDLPNDLARVQDFVLANTRLGHNR